MVSSDLWTDIDSKLGEMFMMIPENVFTDFSVMAVADLLQVPSVGVKFIFLQFSSKTYVGYVVMVFI